MAFSRSRFFVFSVILILSYPLVAWGQSDTSSAQQIQALQTQLDEMKAQMASLQIKIAELSNANAIASTSHTIPVPAAAGSSSLVEPTKTTVTVEAQDQSGESEAAKMKLVPQRQVGQATATYQTDSQDQIAATRIDNAPLDPRFPGYFRLPGTQTLLRIGGYFKTDFIYDLKPPGNTDSFIPSSFPIPTVAGVNNTTVSVRPTRMNLDFLIPVSSSSVRFFLELDMFG